MIFSGQRLGQESAGRTGQAVSATATAAAISPVSGIAGGVNQAILPAKVAVNVPVPLGAVSVAGTISPVGGVVVSPVASPPVVGSWIGNVTVKPVGNQVAVNKWQEGLVARSSDVAKSVGNQTGLGQTGLGQNNKGPGSRSSSSWW